ncbi:L-type lectin-domain containing receptor kinase IX.1-like isoform X2 [Carex rostrata]
MVIPDLCSRPIQLLYLCSIYLFLIVPHGGSVSFNFNFSDPNTVKEHINFEGDASPDYKEKINLTENITYSKGRATYYQPVPLWDKDTGEVTNFTTRFSFLIKNTTSESGDGLAFFLSSYPSKIPPNSNGGALGLFNAATDKNASANQVVAVEFDTFFNPDLDPNSANSTDCHIGIDVNTINSTYYQIIPNYLFVGTRMTAHIEYNSWQKLLSLSLWQENNSTIQFNLNGTVDITTLPSNASVGFSAATRSNIETHQIFWWSFNSSLGIKALVSKDKNKISVSVIVRIAVGTFIMFIVVGIFIYHLTKRSSIKKIREIDVTGDESIDEEFEKGRGPKRFPYSELVEATNGFGENEKLGEGGFGSVYRGILKDENIHVAVKRVSKDSKQGKKEYMSEVSIISQLRHQNLVQLIGWCHDHGEFLLVYELMHKGSLDKHLYSKETFLTWSIRHNIALGLGSALLYLHEEWEQCVVHRDIKPSNIMLDSSFNAKLSDFGLARLIDHNQEVETVAAGTRGYIAPECVLGTANASTHSDVFSFGVVLLEIACGRRSIMPQKDERKVSLVTWVWDLYGRKALMEAVDPRLNSELENRVVVCLMIVGLWCAHQEKFSRPSIRQAMSVLHFQSNLPILPPKMPMPVYITSLYPNMQLYTCSEATSSGIAQNSTKSASASSSDSSWLLKQELRTF